MGYVEKNFLIICEPCLGVLRVFGRVGCVRLSVGFPRGQTRPWEVAESKAGEGGRVGDNTTPFDPRDLRGSACAAGWATPDLERLAMGGGRR